MRGHLIALAVCLVLAIVVTVAAVKLSKGKKKLVRGNAWLAWSNPYWWDEENNRGYAWIVNFSTKNIVTNHLSMQLSVSNNAGNQVSKPAFGKPNGH